MARYELTFIDEQTKTVEKADIDEECRAVKEVVNEEGNNQGYKFNYYPFESLKSIKYLSED
ncbi:MAG: hypothetical protein JW844_04705 [Candidatus Omnitrophica bacterium]|nr:hypothetical protein [Candidatus Omnitrophota bacterium]